jgi:hypothetical protein
VCTAAAELETLADKIVLARKVRSRTASLVRDAAKLEREGWRKWYAEIFGQSFVDSLDSAETDDRHHSEAIEWHWESRRALLQGNRPPNDWFAYFPTWSRGHLKSTIAEAMVVTDAGLSSLYSQPGFCLYLRREKDKLQESISNIESLLSGEQVRALFPLLSQVGRNEETNQRRQWTATFLHTKANYVIRGGTISSAQAGSRIVKTRPTFIVPDDVEGREDSVVISENNFKALTTEILPMRQANTLTFWAQNLISRYTARYRIEKGQVRVLTNRKPTQPVPAVRDPVYEVRTVNGAVKDCYVSGRSTWKGWDAKRIQDEIDTMGLPAFKKECQHEVDQDTEGLVLQNWNDSAHVISYSQFAAVYGTRDLPFSWYKYVFNDWARTNTKYHANVAGVLTVSAQNTRLPGCVFLFHPMTFPPGSAPEDVAERILTTITPKVRVKERWWDWRELIVSTLRKTNLEHLIGDITKLVKERRSILADVIPKLVKPILRAQHYRAFRGSHDQNTVGRKGQDVGALEVMRTVFGLPFEATNPGGDGGVDRLNMLQKVDYTLDHPFKPGEKGFSNYYLVTDDDRSQKPIIIDGVEVYPPVAYSDVLSPEDLKDGQRARYQFRNCRYRDPKLTETGESGGGDILKADDDFCLVGESLVLTSAGERPIREVRAGESVWTRAGWRRVVAAGMTSPLAEVFTAELSDGRTLTGTGKHPVWVNDKGWTDLCLLQVDDILTSCQTTKPSLSLSESFSTESLSTDTRRRSNVLIAFTSPRMYTRAVRALVTCTLNCGRRLTGIFRWAMKFITETGTPLTMTCPTLRLFPNLSIAASTPRGAPRPQSTWSIWRASDHWLTRGIPRRKGVSGTASIPRRLSESPLSATVSFAGRSTKRRSRPADSVLNSVPTGSVSTSSVTVKQVRPSGRAPAYNLKVEGVPEFCANGVLVHNCNGHMMLFYDDLLRAAPLTYGEKVRAIAPVIQTLEEKDGPLTESEQLQYFITLGETKRVLGRSGAVQQFDENLNPVSEDWR